MLDNKDKKKCKIEEADLADEEQKVGRRDLIKNMLGLGACVAAGTGLVGGANANAAAAEDAGPASLPPQEGDSLVHAEGDNEGKPVSIDELKLNKAYIRAWPMDSDGVIRNGSRFNRVLIMKLNPDEFDEKTKPFSQDGVVVYSAVCTHQGCDISAWVEAKKHFFCYCHYSRFDPLKFGKVAYGPARKKLPLLPIKIEDTGIEVAGNFTRKVTAPKKH